MEMEKWYRGTSLKEDISLLCDKNNQDRNFINILVMNIILKYLATYLGVFSTNVNEVKSKVEKVMN